MANMYNLGDEMQTYFCCPMIARSNMSSQPVPCCQYRSGTVGCQSMNMYGAQTMWNSAPNQYIHAVEMKPVALEDIME